VRSYEWDLGDGTRASGRTVSHVYGRPSEFGVRLVVTDSGGQTATATTRIAAVQSPPAVSAEAPRPIALGDVHFAFDSAELSADGRSALDEAAQQIRKHPERPVRAVGHTDASGPEDYNQTLSERRARAVVDYLSRIDGLSEQRFEAIGKGESEPAAPNDTRESRSENRRVDLDIPE
jgi:OOP family OmpA-OmpF porin